MLVMKGRNVRTGLLICYLINVFSSFNIDTILLHGVPKSMSVLSIEVVS